MNIVKNASLVTVWGFGNIKIEVGMSKIIPAKHPNSCQKTNPSGNLNGTGWEPQREPEWEPGWNLNGNLN